MSKIVNTDNFAGDYPNECFVTGIPCLSAPRMQEIADAINKAIDPTGSGMAPRYYKVVDENYVLSPGFEP